MVTEDDVLLLIDKEKQVHTVSNLISWVMVCLWMIFVVHNLYPEVRGRSGAVEGHVPCLTFIAGDLSLCPITDLPFNLNYRQFP